MRAPIAEFALEYASSGTARLHMPGHKGIGEIERLDITEIKGADSLYEAEGIIAESEANASHIFGSDTFYSTEGSSLAIRAMLYLASLRHRSESAKPIVLAGRNAHKAFISAAALLDLDVEWLSTCGSYMSVIISPEEIEEKLGKMRHAPIAIYLTSPDYLGNTLDICGIAEVCHRHGIIMLVDNAHGAYLRFLTPSQHPIDLGADMCVDSAHKTLPVLTGGAYLHIRRELDAFYRENAKRALALFGSTSPSYLILSSLDKANLMLSGDYPQKLSSFVCKLESAKQRLEEFGYTIIGDEKMKITLAPKSFGYLGTELADVLREGGIECEFADSDYLTLMPSVYDPDSLDLLLCALLSLAKKTPISTPEPRSVSAKPAMSIREALFRESELVPVDGAVGRILASPDAACPPAVPIIMPGEIIEKEHIPVLKYYGKEFVNVIK